MAHQLFNLPPQKPFSAAGRVLPGAKLSFYLTTTSTPADVYTTSALNVAHTQPVEADGAGLFPSIYLDPTVVYKATLTDANDVLQYTVDPVNDQILTQSIIASLLYPITTAETAAGVTPTNYAYIPGDIRRYGAAGDGSTSDNTALQDALDACAGAHIVRIPVGTSHYSVSGRFTAPANTYIVMENGAEIKWSSTSATGSTFLSVATRPGIEVTGDNFRIEGRGTLTGPSVASYVSNESAIFMKGTSTASRKSGMKISGNIELKNWGSYGVLMQFVDDISILGMHIHDLGHIGIFAVSCNHGVIQRNKVHDLTPGASSEVYGISLSHDSTDYDLDPDAGTNGRLADNPFCIDFDIAFNTVYNCVLWKAIDTHGAYDTHIHHNKVYNCRRGINISGGSNDAANYSGEGNSIEFNTITSRKIDGSATSVTGGLIDGIICQGGATVMHRGIRVVGNDIEGCGDSTQVSRPITASRVQAAYIAGNTIRNWAGCGIYTFDGDGVIQGNNFDALSDATTSTCIRIDSSGSGSWHVFNNRHRPQTGTTVSEGLRIDSSNPRIMLGDNDFDIATTPYISVSGATSLPRRHFGAQILTRSTITYSTSMTIDAQNGNEFDITATNGTAFTINAPTNMFDGQRITLTIRNTSGGALGAITWNAVFKMAAWTSPATANSRSIDFKYNGTNWVEIGRTTADVPN